MSLGCSSTQQKLGPSLILEVKVEAVPHMDRRQGLVKAAGLLGCVRLGLGRGPPARAELLAWWQRSPPAWLNQEKTDVPFLTNTQTLVCQVAKK